MTPQQFQALFDVPRSKAADPLADLDYLKPLVFEELQKMPLSRPLHQKVRALSLRNRHAKSLTLGPFKLHRLVRWDEYTTTAVATYTKTGDTVMIRYATNSSDDLTTKQLLLMQDVLGAEEGVPCDEGLAVIFHDQSLPSFEGDDPAYARVVGTGLAAFERRSAGGLGVPVLSEDELYWENGSVHICCLTFEEQSTAAAVTQFLVNTQPTEVGPLRAFVDSLICMPSNNVAEASEAFRQQLAVLLSGERHRLAHQYEEVVARDWHWRLSALAQRLTTLCPVPVGRGAVGFDLFGQVVMIEADGAEITAGTQEEMVVVRASSGELDVRLTRQLLRMRALKPVPEHVQQSIGGDSGVAEQCLRVLSSCQSLRMTTRLLKHQVA